MSCTSRYATSNPVDHHGQLNVNVAGCGKGGRGSESHCVSRKLGWAGLQAGRGGGRGWGGLELSEC